VLPLGETSPRALVGYGVGGRYFHTPVAAAGRVRCAGRVAVDEHLLDRVRAVLVGDGGVDGAEEKRMVGGRSFLRAGRLCCGVSGSGLVVRVGAAGMASALAQPHVSAMTMRGRSLAAFVVVAPEGLADDAELARWVRRGFASTD
jgi:hypothetical protein